MKFKLSLTAIFAMATFGFLSATSAQENGAEMQMEQAEVPAEMAILKSEVGEWDAAITFNMPGAEPTEWSGKEVNTMVGEFWLTSQLDYEMMGTKYGGHGMFGYDSENGNFVGTWYSSDSPHPIPMKGTWNEEEKSITYKMDGKDGMGNPFVGTVKTTYNDDKHKHFEMHLDMGGTMHKMMEIKYTRK